MSEKHTHMDQRRAPIHEALENFRRMRVVPFDVPGHKRGRGNPELTKFLGEQCVGVDVNIMKPLDNLCHPVSVIREAEELAADAFVWADHICCQCPANNHEIDRIFPRHGHKLITVCTKRNKHQQNIADGTRFIQ